MMTVLERVERYLATCDPAISGSGGHNSTFRVACTLIHGFGLLPTESFQLLKLYNEKCEPPWSDAELHHKILSAASVGSSKGFGYLLGADIPPLVSSTTTLLGSLPDLKRPEPDLSEIDVTVRNGPAAYDVWEGSPVRFDSDAKEEALHTEEIIDAIFPGDPYLCAGWASWNFETRRRSAWRGLLSEMPLIVPNPMTGPSGLTKEGKQSQHALASVGRRIYAVIEFDFAETDRSGQRRSGCR